MFTQLKTRTRRALAALTATALLAGTAAVGIAGPASADDALVIPEFTTVEAPTETVGSLTWNISGRFWDHLSSRETTGGATVDADSFSFPVTEVTGAAGAQVIELGGKIRGSFAMSGKTYYWIEVSDLEAKQVDASSWEILGTVSAAVPSQREGVVNVYQSTANVHIGDFSAEGLTPGASVSSSSQSFVDIASVLPTSLQAHFIDANNDTPQKLMSSVTFALDAAPAPEVTANVSAVSAVDGLTVSVAGENFTNLPDASSGKAAVGVYVALVDASIADIDVTDKNVAAVNFLFGRASIVNGVFNTDVVAEPAKLDATKSYKIVVWSAHGDVTASTLLASVPVTVSAAQWETVFPAPVVKETIKSTKAPVVSGTAAFGSTLTASAGTWSIAGVSAKYQWLRNGVAISGATKSTYKLTAADVAKKVSVKVTASKDNYNDGTATSATKTVTKAAAPKATKAATVSGTATFNKTLTAKVGTWNTSGVTYKYQWLRNGVAIKGATKSTYKLTSADVAKKISVKVTASKANYNDGTSTSAATAKVAKVTPSVTAKLAKTSIKSFQKTTITVTVKASGVSKPTGKVTVKVGKKTFTKTLKSSNKGKVTVTVKNLKKGKKQKVTVSYAPSSSSKVVLKSKTISAKPLTVR